MVYKHMLAVTVVALLGAACQETPTAPSADNEFPVARDAVAKIRVCHFDMDTGVWEPIDVSSNGNAQVKHLAHGDRLPGDPVPGTAGSFFDQSCAATAFTVFAIAYTDVDPDDGPGFKDHTDVLIAELVDLDGDGFLSAGDEVAADSYPLDFTASSFGSFGVKSHIVTAVVPGAYGEVLVETGAGRISFFGDAGLDAYSEHVSTGNTTLVQDSHGDGIPDQLVLQSGQGPSQPEDDLSLGNFDDTDGGFIDVELNPAVLAIAYTDVDPNDGPGFKDGTDVLIAKLVDSNFDGGPSIGDEVITDSYPLDFDASAFGSFGVTHHVVSGVEYSGPTTAVEVDGNTALIGFVSQPGEYDSYVERPNSAGNSVLLTDAYYAPGVFEDELNVLAGEGPSQPAVSVDLPGRLHTQDDGFLDVDILYYSPSP